MSNALPVYMYKDPAQVVERQQLVDLGCRACSKHTHLFGKVVCSDPAKLTNKGVPHLGTKCKLFELKD